MDFDLVPIEAGRMPRPGLRARASLDEIRTMPTYRVRGAICDGHWAAMIEGGDVRGSLERWRSCATRAGEGTRLRRPRRPCRRLG